MRRHEWLVGAVLLAGTGLGMANGWAPKPPEIVAMHQEAFEGKSPEQIVRFLQHPSGMVNSAAEAALVAHGHSAVPLMKKMLEDANPYLCSNAAKILVDICRDRIAKEGERKSAETRALFADVQKLSRSDELPLAMTAMTFIVESGEMPDNYADALMAMAQSDDPAIRTKASRAVREKLTDDPEAQVRILTEIYARGTGPDIHSWSKMGIVMVANKTLPAARDAVPALASFLYDVGNGESPLRGFFSNGAIERALGVMVFNMDRENEPTNPIIAKALARAHVRLPICETDKTTKKYFQKSRDLTKDGLDKLSAASVPALLEVVAEERRIFDEMLEDAKLTDPVMNENALKKAQANRMWQRQYIDDIEALAAKLKGAR